MLLVYGLCAKLVIFVCKSALIARFSQQNTEFCMGHLFFVFAVRANFTAIIEGGNHPTWQTSPGGCPHYPPYFSDPVHILHAVHGLQFANELLEAAGVVEEYGEGAVEEAVVCVDVDAPHHHLLLLAYD